MNLADVSVISSSGITRERVKETECKTMQRREIEYIHTARDREKKRHRNAHTCWKILFQKENSEE